MQLFIVREDLHLKYPIHGDILGAKIAAAFNGGRTALLEIMQDGVVILRRRPYNKVWEAV